MRACTRCGMSIKAADEMRIAAELSHATDSLQDILTRDLNCIASPMGFLLLPAALLCLFSLPSSGALKCWESSNSTAKAEWSIRECNTTNNETACLGQFRLHNKDPLPSFFGCHTPKMRCNYSCKLVEGQDSEFSCCCSSDLCNGFPPQPDPLATASFSTLTHPAPVTAGVCAEKGCSQNCFEHKGRAVCYCNGGYTLAADGVTCADLDECAHNNGGCEANCHNRNGTGYYCSCHDYQILKDNYRCENYTGLICLSQTCNGSGCSPKTVSYCDQTTSSQPHCQATYKFNKDTGSYQVRLLSCFSGDFECEQGGCTLRRVGNANQVVYYCCCDGHLCNDNIQYVN